MKKVLFSVVLLSVACFSFAQQKNVKDARSIANGTNPDFAKAESLINEALVNSETSQDANTWNVAGFIQKRINEKEMEKAYLRQEYDTARAYNGLVKMYDYFIKADEYDQLPDEKGKVKLKFRKANVATMVAERGNLINGGIYYFNDKDDSKEAVKFFGMYVDMASNPLFEKEDYAKNDTLLAQIAYYATLAAMKAEDNAAIKRYAPVAAQAEEEGKYALEILATAYKAEDNTDLWLATLQEGVKKYPDYAYFFGHLIDYYSNNNKFEEALSFANDMISSDPNNPFFTYVQGYLYHNMKDYDKAIASYEKTIALDPTYAEAYSNLGLIYCLKAQDVSDATSADMNDPNYAAAQQEIKGYYEQARPYYEKARQLKPDQTDLWLQGLYRVYYNLNLGDEFDEIEKLM